jgi:hypothetical protein
LTRRLTVTAAPISANRGAEDHTPLKRRFASW